MKLIALGFTFAALATSIARPADPAPGTCPGRGYLPYGYPSFDSCPCGADGCYHPRRYYACGGDADPDYKQAFWRRWLRAHFCGGSMLEGVPCHCIYPPGRAVLVTGPPVPALALPPQSAETAPERDDAAAIPTPGASSEPIPAGESFLFGPEAIDLDAEVGSLSP
ncbi:MAG: hypothetical protein WBC44_00915 [Planctomycetaceae bacterium]